MSGFSANSENGLLRASKSCGISEIIQRLEDVLLNPYVSFFLVQALKASRHWLHL